MGHYFWDKLLFTLSDPIILGDKLVEATGLFGNSLNLIFQYLIILTGCFIFEIVVLGWRKSSIYRMFNERNKSINGDIICWLLTLFGVYDFFVFISSFGLFYLMSGIIQSKMFLGLGEYLNNDILLFSIIFVLGDFKNYIDHYLKHKIGSLWTVHMYHHSATSLNLITTYRFHFLGTGVSMIFNALFFALIGASPEIFTEIYLLTMIWGILLHGDFKFNFGWLGRWIFVTPQLHKIHHSVEKKHFDKNFGTIFIIWDRIFGTYHAEDEVKEVGVENGPYNKRGFIHDMYLGFKMFVMNLTSLK